MLIDSHKDTVSGKKFGFWQYFGFSGGKLGPKMNQNNQLWVRPVSLQTLNFERLFRDCLCLVKDDISVNSSHICGRKGPETSQKGPFMGAASPQKYLKVYNLTTTNATLMKLITIM